MATVYGNEDVACYFTTKHSWRGKYKRIFSIGTKGITTYNPSNLEVTNQWAYNDFCRISPSVKASNELIITMKKSKFVVRYHGASWSGVLTVKILLLAGASKKIQSMTFSTEHRAELLTDALCFCKEFSDFKAGSEVVTPCSLDQIDPTSNQKLCSYNYKDLEGVVQVSDYPGGIAIVYGGFSRLHLFALEQRDELIRKMSEYSMAYVGISVKQRNKPITHDQFLKHKFGKFSEDEHITSLAEFKVQKLSSRQPVFAIIRDTENPQMFTVEFIQGQAKKFRSTDSNLFADCNNLLVAGFRLAPVISRVDEEVESHHLRFLAAPPATFAEAVERFNSNIPYNGLLHAVTQDGLFAENKEKLITGAITALLAMEGDQTTITPEGLEGQFHSIRRLVASKAGFQAFTTLPKFRDKLGVKVVKALKRNDDGVTHAAIDMLCALMQPMHDNYDLRQEQMNKSSLLSSRKFLGTLLEIFTTHVNRSTGALVVSSLLDFLTETTEGTQFDTLLEMVADLGRSIFRLFQEGDSEVAARMQDLALAEGALPRHLHTAMYTQSTDSRLLTNRQLSRHLVTLWVTGNPTAMALLKRIMPAGMMNFLSSEEKVPESEEDKLHVRNIVKLAEDSSKSKKHQYLVQLDLALTHWRTKMGFKSKEVNQKPVILRKRRQRIKSDANWEFFYYKFNQDHSQPNLIWNYKTREELREALEAEMRAFTVDKDLGASHVISWNHQEFEVRYECLSEEIKIGDYYLRLLLEEDEEATLIQNSTSLAMTKVYSRCYDEIGAFNDTRYIVGMLEKTVDRLERDRLILFLNALIKNKRNVKEMMDVNGIRVLVELLTLAHLHTTRAVVPFQSNLLEASPEMMQRDTEKEWYYGNKEKERLGPFSFKDMKEMAAEGTLRPETKCWAQGMDGWRPLQSISQLKWYLLATGTAVMNETDLAVLILNMLIKMCEFYPNRDSDGAILLLTFDPIIVEKVAILLFDMMLDNPILPRLYLTGVFFFIMMYTGSNVLPIGRFLQEVHVKQAFRTEEGNQSDLFQRSILSPILPEAMVCYLENHGHEKFAQIFLGEFDTPEAIWSNEMSTVPFQQFHTLSWKTSCSVTSFTCGICATRTGFPTGQSENRVADEARVRKAYFRMAQKYHPDKNPDGRDIFEKVNKAYEFLCSKDSRKVQGPDPHNIVLILKAQSILFKRYKEELQPYKYAGYPMLIKTIRMETEDGTAFSKDAPLLAAASELAFHTINCSALNAEELRREDGIEVLQEAYSRCLSEISRYTEPGGVAVQFEECREKITEMPDIIKDLCRVLYHKNLPALCSVASQCVSAFCVDFWLQTQLLQAGVLWHLLLFLFNYDYTLDEGGVEKSAETNQQEISNNLARLSIDALARLGGYLTDENATPENPAIRKSLSKMLTPYIAKQLSNDSPKEILKLLNSNSENPYLIWDNATRAELIEFLEKEQLRKIKTAPIKFAADLIEFLGSEAQYLHSLMALMATDLDFKKNQKRLDTSTMALEALRNVIKNNPGTEAQCIGHYKLIFSLLRMTKAIKLQKFALEVISSTTANKNCVAAIADADILGFLFLTLHTLPSDRLLTVDTMHALCSNTKLVKETMYKGKISQIFNALLVFSYQVSGLIYLLDLFCNGTNPTVRERSAELFSKMMSDKLIGPKVKIVLAKFLPAIFMDAMRDSAEASVHMFEANQENPELIWNTEAREKICSVVKQLKDKHYEAQKDSPDIQWKLPEDFEIMFDDTVGELIVGGIYLRLFIQQPAWVLRKPKEFLIALLQTFVDKLTKPSSRVPGLGHIPHIIKSMSSSNDGVIKSAVQVIHILSGNEALQFELVQYLLDLLNGTLKINKILEASSVWASYRDQKHDLFISDKPAVAGYLTGTAGVAGYLTMGSSNSNTISSVPPPVDRENSLDNHS
ncbi:DnaJ-like protein subfamily C member 13 [Acropora cervicornis]|uniref:DnaJ-like protein subfamily C member 13 n=1 Tax=Acropora cervicornis TaxID=6130 RepID=A0AAD9V558_ACRCE|nr:DnaJ-like protein subfamily C member 13 [Acropora cervicornis]